MRGLGSGVNLGVSVIPRDTLAHDGAKDQLVFNGPSYSYNFSYKSNDIMVNVNRRNPLRHGENMQAESSQQPRPIAA